MSFETSTVLADLGGYAANIASAVNHEKGIYPVFGAEGNEFIIEIAVGPRDRRRILKTIYVEIRREQMALPASGDTSNEHMLLLPDESLLIALLGLFEYALGANTQILHPLNCAGDFLSGWHQAVIAASAQRLA